MFRQLVPIVLLLSLAGVSHAAPPLEVREDLLRVSLLPYGELLVDDTAQLTIDEVSTIAAGFEAIEGRLVREPSDSAYWIRFELRNTSPREVAAVVEITNMRNPVGHSVLARNRWTLHRDEYLARARRAGDRHPAHGLSDQGVAQ